MRMQYTSNRMKYWMFIFLDGLMLFAISGCFFMADVSHVEKTNDQLLSWRIYGAIVIGIIFILQLVFLITIALLISRVDDKIGLQKAWEDVGYHLASPIMTSLLSFTLFGQFWFTVAKNFYDYGIFGKAIVLIFSLLTGWASGAYVSQYVLYAFVFNDPRLLEVTFLPSMISATIISVSAFLGMIKNIKKTLDEADYPLPPK